MALKLTDERFSVLLNVLDNCKCYLKAVQTKKDLANMIILLLMIIIVV